VVFAVLEHLRRLRRDPHEVVDAQTHALDIEGY